MNHREALTHPKVEEVILPKAGLVEKHLELILFNDHIKLVFVVFISRWR
jgi:hypothetical protein